MTERAGPVAAVVAVVVLVGTVAGGLVASALRDDEQARPGDGDVLAALATRGLDAEAARCALPVFADPALRARVLDATDPLADVAAVDACRRAGASSTTGPATTAAIAPVPGPLPDCTGGAGDDAAAVEVCAVDALVALLRQSGLDEVTASCAAEAVVDELGVDAVVLALESGVVPDDLRARLQSAFASCE